MTCHRCGFKPCRLRLDLSCISWHRGGGRGGGGGGRRRATRGGHFLEAKAGEPDEEQERSRKPRDVVRGMHIVFLCMLDGAHAGPRSTLVTTVRLGGELGDGHALGRLIGTSQAVGEEPTILERLRHAGILEGRPATDACVFPKSSTALSTGGRPHVWMW